MTSQPSSSRGGRGRDQERGRTAYKPPQPQTPQTPQTSPPHPPQTPTQHSHLHPSSSSHPPPRQPPPSEPPPAPETVGSLLASTATSLTEALRTFQYADKRLWEPTGDEYEQVRALEGALAEARRDFVEMGRLVGGVGGLRYESDKAEESLHDLRALAARAAAHAQTFRDWLRASGGGPINPTWAGDTARLRRDLRRAQRRAARRIFVGDQVGAESSPSPRCLGGFLVYRAVRRVRAERRDRPAWQQQQQQQQDGADGLEPGRGRGGRGSRRGSLESVVPDCNAVGRFERLVGASDDVAFVCDYCDGFLVWPDLRAVPAERSEVGSTVEGGYPNWAAAGRRCRRAEEEEEEEEGERKVVFAPLAIANHLPPRPGGWMARIVCPYCEEYTYIDQGDGDGERRWEQPEGGFGSVAEFQEHLAWSHTALPRPGLPGLGKCEVM